MLQAFTLAGIAQRCVEIAEELLKLVMRDMADNENRVEQSQLQGHEAMARTQRGSNRPKKLREGSKWRSTHIEKAEFPKKGLPRI